MTNFTVRPKSGAIIRLYHSIAELEVELKVPCWFERVVHSNYLQNHVFHGSSLPGCLCCHHGASVPAEAGLEGHLDFVTHSVHRRDAFHMHS